MAQTPPADPVSNNGSPTITTANTTTTYRRNGKPFSCEPCRIGKLKCGHELPTCSRCLRRGKQKDCIYHPAPMTKPRDASIQKPKRTSSSQSNINLAAAASQMQPIEFIRHNSNPAPPPAVKQHTNPFPFPEQTHFRTTGNGPVTNSNSTSSASPYTPTASLFKQAQHAGRAPETVRDKTGYLGSSAFSAVFTENSRSLGIQDEEPERNSSPSIISQDKIHQGAEVLSLLRNMNVFTVLQARWFRITDGIAIIRPMFQHWISGIEREFGELLRTHRTVQDLYPLSELVWRNTDKTVPVDGSTTTSQWCELHTGQNLRWETVAAICCSAALISLDLSDWDPALNEAKAIWHDRQDLNDKMKAGTDPCLAFCRDCESITDLYLCVLFESVLVIEAIRGDTHFQAWDRCGDVINTLVHLGLHQEKRQDENTPFIVSEMRIRLFDMVFSHDKSLSTFLGRPPRLSYRYCVLQLPLDLSDEEMFLEGEELQRAIGNLNEGWNTQGRLHRITWRRVWTAHAKLREDILEIMLGTNSEHLAERGEQVREQIRIVQADMPDLVHTDIVEALNHCQDPHHPFLANWDRERVPWILVHLLSIKAGMIHTSLLLEKALLNRLKGGNPSALVEHARKLLRYVLAGAAKRDFLRDFSIDLTFLIAFHGVPAAGILAVEMLKQEQSRQFTSNVLPRSETIQDLSVFISALSAVEPSSGGNYYLCKKAMKLLKKVLDKILSPQVPVQPSPEATFDDPSMYFPGGTDADFLTWLENIEWERGSLFNN